MTCLTGLLRSRIKRSRLRIRAIKERQPRHRPKQFEALKLNLASHFHRLGTALILAARSRKVNDSHPPHQPRRQIRCLARTRSCSTRSRETQHRCPTTTRPGIRLAGRLTILIAKTVTRAMRLRPRTPSTATKAKVRLKCSSRRVERPPILRLLSKVLGNNSYRSLRSRSFRVMLSSSLSTTPRPSNATLGVSTILTAPKTPI